jgi:hypothetical protein
VETFGAALLGALVGGFAAMVGSLFVARWQSTRTYRIRIYDDLLPPLLRYAGDDVWPAHAFAQEDPDNYREAMLRVVRAGHVASRRDGKKVDNLNQLLADASVAYGGVPLKPPDGYDRFKDWGADEAKDAMYSETLRAYLDALGNYRDWLKERLS